MTSPVAPTAPTAAPTAPDPTDRSTFNARAYAWTTWVKDHNVSEMSALASNAYTNAQSANESATSASSNATLASGYEAASLGHASNASASASAAATSASNAAASATVASTGLGTLTGQLNFATPVTIASATTTDIGAATSNDVTISGTTTITGLGTKAAGAWRKVTFSGALTLTHNATSLILPGAANITTVAGDTAEFVSLGSGNWRCTDYTPATVTGTGAQVRKVSPSLTTPTVDALTATTSVLVTGTGGAGYGTGAGGTVTQATSRATSVTLNKPTGSITMFTAAGSPTWSQFGVNCSAVAATDTVVVALKSGYSNYYSLQVIGVSAGAFSIAFAAVSGTASDTPVISFTVIKGVTA